MSVEVVGRGDNAGNRGDGNDSFCCDGIDLI